MRAPGWESRLAAELRAAAARPFEAKTWNCGRFAWACACAVAGRPIPARWRGSLEASADAVLTRVEPRRACRGDVVLARVPQASLGVCVGSKAVFLGCGGLELFPMTTVTAAWSV